MRIYQSSGSDSESLGYHGVFSDVDRSASESELVADRHPHLQQTLQVL
jgi:hypothetical protein